MPELPEVENVVRGLSKHLIGKTIIDVSVFVPKLIGGRSVSSFKNILSNKKIIDIKRRAKNILFFLEDDYILLVHLKMTGHFLLGKWRVSKDHQLIFDEDKTKGQKYIRAFFVLSSGEILAFSDLRKFGKMKLLKKDEMIKELSSIGIEALNLIEDDLISIFQKSKSPIKKVLLDQSKIAGIGNIYADDILWQAKIHPLRIASSLSKKEIKEILLAIKDILNLSISLGGASLSDYFNLEGGRGSYGDHKLVYGRDGEPCLRCKTIITKLKLSGRTTRYCPKCQLL